MTIGEFFKWLFAAKHKTYYVVGRGIPIEETECSDFMEAIGMAQEFARSNSAEVCVCEVMVKVKVSERGVPGRD